MSYTVIVFALCATWVVALVVAEVLIEHRTRLARRMYVPRSSIERLEALANGEEL